MCLHRFLCLAKVYSSHSEKTCIFGEKRQQKSLSKSLETKKLQLLCNVLGLHCSPQQGTEYWRHVGVGEKLISFSFLFILCLVAYATMLASE